MVFYRRSPGKPSEKFPWTRDLPKVKEQAVQRPGRHTIEWKSGGPRSKETACLVPSGRIEARVGGRVSRPCGKL